MNWFRHDYFASNDIKIRKLLRNYGECAYGAYWLVVELLYQQGGSASAEEISDTFELMSSPNMKEILADSGLFQIGEDGSWSSNRVKEEIEYQEESRRRAIEAGRKGGINRAINAGQTLRNPQAPLKQPLSNPQALSSTLLNLTKPNKEKKSSNELSQKKGVWVKPSLSQIQSYCKERKNNVDPEEFYDFYESKGWMVGKNHMKDWKACVRTWEKAKTSQNTPASRKDYSDIGVQKVKKIDWGV
jgi:uncharacterized protein YdaU (DUF1376 family)